MARKARRKEPGTIGKFMVELSALAGILGISQPMVRDNLWTMLRQRAIANSTLVTANVRQAELLQTALPLDMQPQVAPPLAALSQPASLPEPPLSAYPSAYTAQVTLPTNPINRLRWQGSQFSPLGGYQ